MNLLGVLRDPLHLFLRAGRQGGADIVRVALGPGNDVYLVNRPHLIEDVLVTRRHQFAKPSGLGDIRPAVGENLQTSDGYYHQCHRSLLEPVTSAAAVTRYSDVVVAQAAEAAGRWSDGAQIDAHRDMLELTFRIAGRVLFDCPVERDAPDVQDALEEVLSHCARYTQPLGAVLDRLPLPSTRRIRRGGRQVDAFLDDMIRRCHSGAGAESVLGGLLAAIAGGGDEPPIISDAEIRQELVFVLLAARETIGDVLAWTWYELSRAPEAQEALRTELDSVLGGRLPTHDDLARLPYLGQVVKEGLRLWPVGWGVMRQTVTECPLGGFRLPGRAYVLVSPWVTQRDARYFPGPDEFQPRRWAEDGVEPEPFSYFPFSGGPRTCLGSHLASMILPLVVATLARHWSVEPVGTTRVQPVPHFAIRPRGGIALRVSRRG